MDKVRFWKQWEQAEGEGYDLQFLLIWHKNRQLEYMTFIDVEDLKSFVEKCHIRKYYVLSIKGIFEIEALKNAVMNLL